jgi:nicotinate dehydrogenase subunit B
MVLGDTAMAPNQGATIASASLQIHAEPLRRAAAQARAWLLARAASTSAFRRANGTVRVRGTVAPMLLRGQHIELRLDPAHR